MSDSKTHFDPDASLGGEGTGRALVPTQERGLARIDDSAAETSNSVAGKIIGFIVRTVTGGKGGEEPADADAAARDEAYKKAQERANRTANGKGDDGVDVTA